MNKDIEDLDDDFNFPEQVLDQVSECSPEGYILFAIDEYGQVEMFSKGSSDVVDSGLRIKAMKILGGMDAVENQEIGQNMFFNKYGHPEDMEEEEEEGLGDSD